MTRTSCVRHKENTRFFIKYEDIISLCNDDQSKVAAHRVLETKTNARIAALEDRGHPITEDALWLTMSWEDFVRWSLKDRKETVYRRVLPELEQDGFVKSRYVKLGEDNQVLCNEKGEAYTYTTYKEAQEDSAVDGLIMKQYRYLYTKVNAALDTLSDGGDDPDPPQGEEEKEEATAADERTEANTARGGNLRTAARSVAVGIITQQPLSKKAGGTNTPHETLPHSTPPPAQFDSPPVECDKTPCQNEQAPPVECDSNKNLLEESAQDRSESTRTTAPGSGAAVNGQFFLEKKDEDEEIWTREAILNLAAQYLDPLPLHIAKKQREDNERQWNEAAQMIQEAAYFRLIGPKDAIAHLVSLLNYVSHPESPSWWVQDLTLAQGKPVRLWHIARNYVRMGLDMIRDGWFLSLDEEETPQRTTDELAPPVVVDARAEDPEPAMTPVAVLPPVPAIAPTTEPPGMSGDEADVLMARIRVSHGGFCVSKRHVPAGGYVVEVATSPERSVCLYAPGDWEDLVRSWSRGPTLRERLAQLQARKAG